MTEDISTLDEQIAELRKRKMALEEAAKNKEQKAILRKWNRVRKMFAERNIEIEFDEGVTGNLYHIIHIENFSDGYEQDCLSETLQRHVDDLDERIKELKRTIKGLISMKKEIEKAWP